ARSGSRGPLAMARDVEKRGKTPPFRTLKQHPRRNAKGRRDLRHCQIERFAQPPALRPDTSLKAPRRKFARSQRAGSQLTVDIKGGVADADGAGLGRRWPAHESPAGVVADGFGPLGGTP